jgi:vacuolar-type H+-ATPase subunit F/Vma7
MSKLVQAWIDNPTEKNAMRIFNHLKKHPMSIIMVDSAQYKTINQALESIQ